MFFAYLRCELLLQKHERQGSFKAPWSRRRQCDIQYLCTFIRRWVRRDVLRPRFREIKKQPASFETGCLAGALGFEPRTKVLETHVLPLHHAPTAREILYREQSTMSICLRNFCRSLLLPYTVSSSTMHLASLPKNFPSSSPGRST